MRRWLVLAMVCVGSAGCGASASSDSQSSVTRPDPERFASSPGQFQGQAIQVSGVLASELAMAEAKSLKTAVGSSIKLVCQGKEEPFELVVFLPPGLDPLPPAKAGDEVMVAFTCGEGSHSEGNTAIRVGLAGP